MRGRDEKCVKCWSEHLDGEDHLEDINVDERVKLEWILEKRDGKMWTGFI